MRGAQKEVERTRLIDQAVSRMSALKKPDLKMILKAAQLKVSGKKQEMIDRLAEFVKHDSQSRAHGQSPSYIHFVWLNIIFPRPL